MKNRPLLGFCLALLAVIILAVTVGEERCIPHLRLSPMEKYIKDGGRVQVLGTVYQTEQKNKVQAIYLKNNSIRGGDASFFENRILVYTDPRIQIKIGNQVLIKGEAAFFDAARNPGNFDQKRYYQKEDIHSLVWADEIKISDGTVWPFRNWLHAFRQEWKDLLVRYMGEKEGTALAAMMLGEKSGMDAEVKSLYQASGIGHILAISGLHLSFLGVGAYHILRKVSGSFGPSGAVGIGLLFVYVLMIGLTVSVVRSLIMFLFRVGADITGRHYDAPTALAVSAAVILCWRPLYLYDGGFWLSFGAVLAMILLLPEFQGLPWQGLWASLCVNIVLLPVLLYYFYEFPVYSTFLNLLIIPLTSALLVLGMTGSLLSLVFSAAGVPVLMLCRWILLIFEKSCEFMLALPGARVVAGKPALWQMAVYYAVILMVFLLWKQYGKWQILCLYVIGILCLFWRPLEGNGVSVTVLDVGQGDSIFIRGPDGGAYLVDSGSSDVGSVGQYRIEPFLKSRGVGTLDYVWVTHGDGDHLNGLEELLRRQSTGVRIKALILPPRKVWDEALTKLGKLAEEEGTAVYTMEKGQMIKEGELSVTCLAPGQGKEGEMVEPGNEASLVLALQYQGFDMLLTGDVEGAGEEMLTETLKAEYADTSWEVLKAAHHGSKSSTGENFLKAASPLYGLISAGRDNRYGHPHPETLERFYKSGTKVLSTQNLGAVTIQVVEFEMKIQYTIERTD